jgi:uncharacterized membrane protein YraQ (UPF0718 family)
MDSNITSDKRTLVSFLSVVLVGFLFIAGLLGLRLFGQFSILSDEISVFSTVFLGIFIEAAPFLLMGTLASGLVEVFVCRDVVMRFMPRRALSGALVGSMMGLFFPVCECGVVPLARRFIKKGVPIHIAITFMLVSPVVNPIVMASTISAFGLTSITFWRFGLSFLIAFLVGLIFSVERQPFYVVRPNVLPDIQGGSEDKEIELGKPDPLVDRVRRALLIAGDEFFEMGRYLVIGTGLAALMQTFVPQSTLTSLGSGPVTSVLVMMILAVVLSVCSTVDSFVALAFANTFSMGSVLSFLVFGPMVDIKSTLLYLRVFRRKIVLYILLLTGMITLVSGIFINLFLS